MITLRKQVFFQDLLSLLLYQNILLRLLQYMGLCSFLRKIFRRPVFQLCQAINAAVLKNPLQLRQSQKISFPDRLSVIILLVAAHGIIKNCPAWYRTVLQLDSVLSGCLVTAQQVCHHVQHPSCRHAGAEGCDRMEIFLTEVVWMKPFCQQGCPWRTERDRLIFPMITGRPVP